MMQPGIPVELLESVVDLMEDGVVISLPDGSVVYHNPVILDMFGLSKDSSPRMLSDIGEVNWNRRMNRAAFDAGSQYGIAAASDRTMRFEEKVTAGSTVRFLEITVRRMFPGSRKSELRVIVVRDVSPRRRLEATLQTPGICGLKTSSPEMMRLFERARQIAASDASVLLQGESGTGKSCIARLIHQESWRSGHPFVEVNCAAIPESLMESEFFGHAKGAFTGAVDRNRGKFLAANHGTLFLDEIGEIPVHLQAKLLHAIEERRFHMVGSSETIAVDTRFVSASNINLRDAVDRGSFRGDLYYRIAVIPLLIPPLRDRVGDIPVLIQHFIEDLVARGQKADVKFSKGAWQALMNYPWPGNIRELSNAVEHSVICADKGVVEVDSLPQDILRYSQDVPDQPVLRQFAADEDEKAGDGGASDVMRAELLGALRKARGSKAVAAQLLGIDRTTLWRRMQRAGIGG
jgi:transcriptional regulator with PAS, ATPase and Fis domain